MVVDAFNPGQPGSIKRPCLKSKQQQMYHKEAGGRGWLRNRAVALHVQVPGFNIQISSSERQWCDADNKVKY